MSKTVEQTLRELGYGHLYDGTVREKPPEPRCLACCDVEDFELDAYGGCRCCGRRYDAAVAEPIDRELRRTGRTLGTIIADWFRRWRGLQESWQ